MFVPPFFFNGCHDEHATSVVAVVEFVVDVAADVIAAVDESAVVTVDCLSVAIVIDVSDVAFKLSSNWKLRLREKQNQPRKTNDENGENLQEKKKRKFEKC